MAKPAERLEARDKRIVLVCATALATTKTSLRAIAKQSSFFREQRLEKRDKGIVLVCATA